jgi:hypothetical protein
MIRKMLLVAAAVAMPIGIIAGTAGVASAHGSVTDTTTGVDATCTSTGGTISFKTAIGVANGSGYVYPTKNKGQKIKITGVNLTCTSPAVSGTFTGVASGKLLSLNPTELPAVFYSAATILGNDPAAGGSLSGTLKIKWTPPPGQKFSDKVTINTINSVVGGIDTIGGDSYGSFAIPGSTPGSLSGAFAGTDNGATATSFEVTAQDETALTTEATTTGISSLPLASGTAALQ